MYTVKVSVGDLITFVLQSGDIDSGFTSSSRLAEGIWHHQAIQKANKLASNRDKVYTAEVGVAYGITRKGIRLEVGGRIDGVFDKGGEITIQEIKSTARELHEIDEESFPLHWAQAQCYAYMYGREHKKDAVTVQLVYSQLDTRDTSVFEKRFLFSELENFFVPVAESYIEWARVLKEWAKTRNASIKNMAFPFESYREGQQELVNGVSDAVHCGNHLFAQAPTGIGKTMATLYPSIQAVGKNTVSKIFYATAKTVTRAVAQKAVDTLQRKGLRLKTVTITAKDKICFNPDAECKPEDCEFAKGYYDRLRPAIKELFEQDALDRPAIEAMARKHSLCPFELTLDMSLWADCIICDYNYLFDPRVYLRRFFSEEERSDEREYVFLVDEAHNLVDRSREMFSAQLARNLILNVQKSAGKPRNVKDVGRMLKLNRILEGLAFFMEEASGACGREDEAGTRQDFVVKEDAPFELVPMLKSFIVVAGKILEKTKPSVFSEKLLELYFIAHNFLRTAEYFDHRYRCYYQEAEGDFTVKLFCVDPSYLMKEALERARCAVFFSATLTPIPYFQELLGGGENADRLKLGSPFPKENLRVLVDDRVATTYRMREFSYDRIAREIAALCAGKVGNYIAYFPSYKYMNEVRGRFIQENPAISVISQGQGMSEAARSIFLEEFSRYGETTLVGFAVMGGVFGEGIDLVGERLSGVIIVGVGLPQISLERNLIKNYFQESHEAGYEYAYIYPGMNKVLQAAGRVIRTETDRGVILLIDERFARPPYSDLIPDHWHPLHHLKNTPKGHTLELVQEFWRG